MTESPVGYFVKIDPTEAELNLIARLRQLRGMCIIDSDSMTIWPAPRPEHLNGKRASSLRPELPFVLPIDT